MCFCVCLCIDWAIRSLFVFIAQHLLLFLMYKEMSVQKYRSVIFLRLVSSDQFCSSFVPDYIGDMKTFDTYHKLEQKQNYERRTM